MLTAFYSRGMIPVFPVSTFSIFPLIVFLPRSSSNQLHRFWNDVSLPGINNQQVNVV
jgi:hypothetical protein